MKKIISICTVILIAVGVFTISVVAEDTTPPVKAPFPEFTIQYKVDPKNPDVLRDNLPIIEYDPDNGWNFYKVELKPTEDVDIIYRYRVCLDEDNERMQLHPKDEEFLIYLNDIFDTMVWFQLNGDIYSDSLSINYFCKPKLAGDHDGKTNTNLLRMRLRKRDDVYTGMVNGGSSLELERYSFEPAVGSIQILEENLQFEQWDIEDDVYLLSQRLALNPDQILLSSILGLNDYVYNSTVHRTSLRNVYIEFFVDDDKFIYLGEEYHFDKYESNKYEVPNYNCCKRYKDEIFIPLETFAELMGFEYGIWNFDEGRARLDYPYIEHAIWRSIPQRIRFKVGEKTAITRYGDNIELPVAPFIIPDDPDIYISETRYRGIFNPMVPLIPLLENLPRYSNKGYWYRPMNDSILISRTINRDSYFHERIIVD